MIDIEKDVFKKIVDAVTIDYPDIKILGEQPSKLAKFPCIIIEEKDNYMHDKSQDSGSLENYAVVMYEVNVYSNRVNGKKDECKRIRDIIDNRLELMGFSRISSVPMSTSDATVYRIVSRYRATVSKNKEIFRR